ncbi:MAG: hypothetical protein GX262_00230 [Clostridia bacterium]|jgi:hypothetical protein|nr:hypothetical protein [Clostridia bacterium]
MLGKILLVLMIAVAVGLSVWQRIMLLKKRNVLDQVPDAPISSFMSEALAQLVGVAGGIYLSLIMLISFLELEIPHRITVAGLSMQPLAFLALALAVLQPIIKQLLVRIRKGNW